MKVLVPQLCPTLCNPVDCSLPGSSVRGILQARILEWVAIPFSRGVFLTQRSNPGLLHCRQTLYYLRHQGPRSSLGLALTWLYSAPWKTGLEFHFSISRSLTTQFFINFMLSFSLNPSSVTSVQSLSHVWLFVTPWIVARQASLSITNSRSSLRLSSIESVMPSSHLILCRPLLNSHPSIHGQKSPLTDYRTILRMVRKNENGLALPRRLPEKKLELRLTKGYPQWKLFNSDLINWLKLLSSGNTAHTVNSFG